MARTDKRKISHPKAGARRAKAAAKGAKKHAAVKLKKKAAKAAVAKAAVEAAKPKAKINVSVPEHEEAKRVIAQLLENQQAVEYLKKNVSKHAVDVINMLGVPRTDEHLAEQLGMKINAIRRILNIMQGYGITNYYVSKNTNGWLSFSWYVNATKVPPFLDYIGSIGEENSPVDENTNDYFICNDCYKEDKFIYTFDAAFEASFRCGNCNSSLQRLDRQEVETMVQAESSKQRNEAAVQA